MASTFLLFRIQLQVSFKEKTSYCGVTVFGDVFVCHALKCLIRVSSVNFMQDDCQGNPVLAYLQCHGTPKGTLSPLANDGYTLTTSPIVFNAPHQWTLFKDFGWLQPHPCQPILLELHISPCYYHSWTVVECRDMSLCRECCRKRSPRVRSCVSFFYLSLCRALTILKSVQCILCGDSSSWWQINCQNPAHRHARWPYCCQGHNF